MGLEKVIRVPYNQRTIKSVLTSINSRNLVAKPWRRVFDVTAPIGSKITVTSRARITESDSRSRLIVANCILRSFDSNNVLRLRLKQRRRRPRSPDCALQRSLEFRCLSASQALSSHNMNTARSPLTSLCQQSSRSDQSSHSHSGKALIVELHIF
jgi:hypothetical protein